MAVLYTNSLRQVCVLDLYEACECFRLVGIKQQLSCRVMRERVGRMHQTIHQKVGLKHTCIADLGSGGGVLVFLNKHFKCPSCKKVSLHLWSEASKSSSRPQGWGIIGFFGFFQCQNSGFQLIAAIISHSLQEASRLFSAALESTLRLSIPPYSKIAHQLLSPKGSALSLLFRTLGLLSEPCLGVPSPNRSKMELWGFYLQ